MGKTNILNCTKMIKIGNCVIGDYCPNYIVAEIGSNFDGDIERAKLLVDIAQDCGADAVKFQSFKSEKIVSAEGFSNLKSGFQSHWDKPVYDVYQAAEFPRDWHQIIFDYCRKKDITFFSAPYDFEAVDLLDNMGVEAFKIGSGDITWLQLIDYVARKGKPIIIAAGASTLAEVDEAIAIIEKTGNDKIILLQCTTNYPSSFENAHLRAMAAMKNSFDVLVGISDHTPGSVVPLGSVALGGCMIEKHFTDNKAHPGPDHNFAMDPKDFREMVRDVRNLEKALGTSIKTLYSEESETVVLQRRCIRATRDLKVGEHILSDSIEVLRPAPVDSIPPKYMDILLGKTLNKDIPKGSHLRWCDIG